MQAQKTNLKKEDSKYYTARTAPEMIDIQEVSYISLEGEGEPGGENFQNSVSAIFSLAYELKFDYKKEGMDFSVPSLEAKWWTDSEVTYKELPPDQWKWKVMIRMPEFVRKKNFEEAKKSLVEKKRLHLVEGVRLEAGGEGRHMQILHVGPYDKIGKAYERLTSFAEENGVTIDYPSHEIYLSDPSRTAPDRLKTIVRIPVH